MCRLIVINTQSYRKEEAAFLPDLKKSWYPAAIMMKTLSVQEAKSFFLTMKPEYYLFSTENQGDGCVPNCLSAISRYTEAVFSELTNRVCFTQGNNMLCFSGVKYINVDETPSIGIIFDVVCTDANKSNADRIFTFIAD